MKRTAFDSEPGEPKKERRGIQSVEVGGQLLVALVEQGAPMLLRELAQKIISEQQKEIGILKKWLDGQPVKSK